MIWLRAEQRDEDFSLARYAEMLEALLLDRPVFCFADLKAADQERRFALWRHDCEFSLAAAEQIAEIDWQMGIRSTFFLLLSSEYNVFEKSQARIVEKILRRGHDIGLHYDLSLLSEQRAPLIAALTAQCNLIERMFSVKISAMSAHMPAAGGRTHKLRGVVDVYHLPGIQYFSDSGQNWRRHFWTECEDRIQVLTHPECWSEQGHTLSVRHLIDAKARFDESWRRAMEEIARSRCGQRVRVVKDTAFQRMQKDR